jgi:hypothetical protein
MRTCGGNSQRPRPEARFVPPEPSFQPWASGFLNRRGAWSVCSPTGSSDATTARPGTAVAEIRVTSPQRVRMDVLRIVTSVVDAGSQALVIASTLRKLPVGADHRMRRRGRRRAPALVRCHRADVGRGVTRPGITP